MQPIILTLTYIIVLSAVVTGLLKMAFPASVILKMLHRATGPASNFLFAIYYVIFQLSESGPKLRVVLAAVFMLLAYAGLVSAKEEPSKQQKVFHISLGIMALMAFSIIFFTLVLMWTGLAASVSDLLH